MIKWIVTWQIRDNGTRVDNGFQMQFDESYDAFDFFRKLFHNSKYCNVTISTEKL